MNRTLRNTSSPRLASVAIAALLLAVAACGSSPGEEATSATSTASIEVAGNEEAIKVGVLAIRSAVAANAQYGPIVEYLQDELGQPFELVPVGQDDLFDAVEQQEVQFTLSNPLSSVQLRRLYGVEFLATVSRINTGAEFGGLIVVNAASDINEIADLAGKDVTCVAFETAAAGCNFQVLHISEQGLDPSRFGSFTETPSQDNIVLAVLNGTVDAGFVRTGQLEKMVAEGTLVNLDEIRILDLADDDYFFPHTTRLYPEWPVGKLSTINPELAARVQEALLSISSDDPALVNAKAEGFIAPPDYGPLDAMIEELELRTWDAPGA